MLPCDVEDIASVDAVFATLREKWGRLDFLVHAIGFSDKNELKGRYADTTRENFSRTMVISCFSFTEARQARGRADAGIRRLDDHADLRRLDAGDAELQRDGRGQGGAGSLGALSRRRFRPRGIRVNAISAGPIRTLAGSGIGDARAMFAFQQKHSPLGRGVTLDELGGSALYLLSDLSGGVTGEIHYVDSGYNIISMPQPGRAEGGVIRRARLTVTSRRDAARALECRPRRARSM